MKSSYAGLSALILIISSVAFMGISIYLMVIGMAIASIVSLASGLLALGGGINMVRIYSECREEAKN